MSVQFYLLTHRQFHSPTYSNQDYKEDYYWKKEYSYGQQFHQYQQNKQLPEPLIWK
jgi:hypothetical protein